MYIPAHFAADEQAVDDLLTHHGAADLITATPEGVVATMLPFVYDPGMRTLRGHLARNNDQWRRPVVGEALVIVRGPDAYISPAWYPSKAEHGRVVPTWDYVTAHVYGRLAVHDDPVWVEQNVRDLTGRHEAGRPQPWSVDDAPPQFIEGLNSCLGCNQELIRATVAEFPSIREDDSPDELLNNPRPSCAVISLRPSLNVTHRTGVNDRT